MATAKNYTLKAVEFDGATGQQIIRDLTTDEIAELELGRAEALTQQAATEAKATARTSALAKLAELGLTEDEIAAL